MNAQSTALKYTPFHRSEIVRESISIKVTKNQYSDNIFYDVSLRMKARKDL